MYNTLKENIDLHEQLQGNDHKMDA